MTGGSDSGFLNYREAVGRIKWFRDNYGFIIPESGGRDIFLHWSVANQCGIDEKDLRVGTIVKFDAATTDDQKIEATRVDILPQS